MNDIIAVVPFWKREKVSEIFWQNVIDIGLRVVAIVSDEPNRKLADKYAEVVVNAPNDVLGIKWNAGVKATKKLDYKYLMVIGSDDLVSKKAITGIYIPEMEKGTKFVGLKDAVAININTGKFRYFAGYENDRRGESIGAGRLIHRDIIERMGYELFPRRKKYMDGPMYEQAVRFGFDNVLYRTGLKPYRVGIKSGLELSKLPKNPFIHDVDLKGYYSKEVCRLITEYGQ